MAREIEIKIPLTDDEYKSIYDAIYSKTTFDGVYFPNSNNFRGVEHLLKNDVYYSRYTTHEERVKNGEPRVIRIRSEQNLSTNEKKSYFCIKYKTIENGIEINSENETFVQDETVIDTLLKISGYTTYFDKKKDALSAYCRSSLNEAIEFHLELEVVNGLKYVEIEVTESDLPADEIRLTLEGLVTQLGLDASKRDSRSWMEIINHL